MTNATLSTPLTVMEATTSPPDGTTRYIDQVVTFAPPETTFVYFTWRTALQARYDVLHIHWPERLFRHSSRSKRLASLALVFLLIAVLKRRGIPIVRTLHNLQPHEDGSFFEKLSLRALDRATECFVTINPVTRAPRGVETYIPHGHYRDRFAIHRRNAIEMGTIVYAGLIRPYKGIERLIECYSEIPRGVADKLRIVGKPTPRLRSHIEDSMNQDPRISAILDFVPDAELVEEITRAEIICLPYDDLHNSGMVLVTLSLDRPLIVPDTVTTRALAEEVGPGWMHLFTGPLTGEKLASAIKRNRAMASMRSTSPILDDRDWRLVGERYDNAFRSAVMRVRRR